ncbi:uncharacterized protein MONBRDRAFT_30281 [Monosiga brevicollis MX1]|uniref:Mitochondrial inner membrane protease ATP23 n=1 Tax=Monosiga brevicollis TaxID=81824 RepID=A9VDI4_MONBE|nr:uncharacterized protein MONBRDRAFT_30281 [Monosiga brevicollis MX1]EDQ84398.1 predicted protein [Monosiga brevicollis MX1]|eukprot:XP_001750799.1 hypothetical protein [Monosiga brevicollis MX1]
MAEASATAAAAPQASAEPMTHAEKNIQFKPCRPEDQQRGERWLQKSLKAPFVTFMLDALRTAGCEKDVSKYFVLNECAMSGAYDAERDEIVLCANNIFTPENMTRVVTHELIHAFDDCRAKVDFQDPRHLACTEIRAASLSGDCFFVQENFNRLKFAWKKQHQNCVKRRASMSVAMVLGLSRSEADAVIEDVYDVCFKDTAPFERIP